MIRRWVRDDRVPDHGLVHQLRSGGIGPAGGHPDEHLLGVPVEERGEIGRERELDHGVFFFARAVVVGTAADAAGAVSLWFDVTV